MTKVLVTGGSGFIGTNLVAALASRGDDVTCLVRPNVDAKHLTALGVRLALGDVTDRMSLASAVAVQEVVYHLAGRTAATRLQFERVNVQGTRNVAAVCAEQSNPPVLVLVSSLAVAGPARDGRPKTEADSPAPVSHYGRSKLGGELAAGEYAGRVPTTVVRPPIVLGEFDRQGLPLFRSIARFGVHLAPNRGRRRFSLIHAADLARLLILAAERGRRLPPQNPSSDNDIAQGRYYAACGDAPSYGELGRMVGEALGRRSMTVLPAPSPLIWGVAAMGELAAKFARRPPVLNLDKAREITAGDWLCSAQTAAEQLGFAPAAPLNERLRQTADWYRRQGWL